MDLNLFCLTGLVCLEVIGLNFRVKLAKVFWSWTFSFCATSVSESGALDFSCQSFSNLSSDLLKSAPQSNKQNFLLDFAHPYSSASTFLFISNGIGIVDC